MVEYEKRRTPRRKVHIPIICWEEGNESRTGRGKEIISKDLSGDGIAFYSQKIYSIGAAFLVDIFLPNQKNPVSCKIKVVSVEMLGHREEYLIGASFIDLAIDNRTRISSSVEKMDLYVVLESAIAGGASDLHLTVGRPPMVRRGDRLLTMAADVIEPGQVEAMLYPLMTREQIKYFEENKELDFAFSPDMDSRFRVNVHSQKGYVEAVLRSIPTKIKTFDELALPVETMEQFCQEKSGLILIAGRTGSGKTTTMMSMVNYINQIEERVVVTIEDPIEYIVKSQRSIVKQRELGSDTRSYSEALRRVLRQDPDVICVGEILDAECLLSAMRASDTGHLVVSTVHAPDTVAAVERLVNFFPPEHAASMRQQLSSCLLGVLFQVLLPNKKEGGRIAATELLLNNTAVKNLIREGRYNLMANVLQTGRSQGMHTLKDSLNKLYDQKIIDYEVVTSFEK
jgi:twitching motility protein PilT